MSSLTEDQRRRMEENRLLALKRRAATLFTTPAPGNINAAFAPVSSATCITESSHSRPTSVNNSQSSSQGANNSQDKQMSYPISNASASVKRGTTPSYSYSTSTHLNTMPSSSTSSTQPQYKSSQFTVVGKTLAGSCKLISRDRFMVEIGYHAQVIALFKNVPGYKYDTTSKNWSFPLTEHERLLESMESLRPDVSIGPLPPFVLKTFLNSTHTSKLKTNCFEKIDQELVTNLFEFQKEGISFGISRGGRVLIADDMGLGKTIQGLGIAHYYYDDWPLLIVAPSTVRYSWREAIWKWLPSVPAGCVTIMETSRDYIGSSRILILSYDLLQKNAADLSHFGVVIIDESHHLKNSKAARTKAALPLIQNAKRAILLSGTPALSRPMELFNQISSINRYIFPRYSEYGIRYCSGKKNAWGWDFNGSSNMEELQLILEETIMIRRMKSDVLQQLPAKIRQMLILDPALVRVKSARLQTTASAFNEGKNLKGMEKRGRLLEYFGETGRAKLDAVVSYIKDLVADGKKFLCFAHHRCVLDGIGAALETIKCKYIRIDGETCSEERKRLCDHFQNKSDVMVALLSITAANSGITLTAANLVVFAELFWNPGILTQAEDRVHRIGQEDSVLVQYLLAKGTSDDVIWPMVADKLDVLSKAGLSKDNFREAGAEALIQLSDVKRQRDIDEYFSPIETNEDLAGLFNDEF